MHVFKCDMGAVGVVFKILVSSTRRLTLLSEQYLLSLLASKTMLISSFTDLLLLAN